MPLIVVLMLICVIAITLVVGVPFGRPSETAELNKDVEQEEEHISAAVDIAATSVGTNLSATFTASTGEIKLADPHTNTVNLGKLNKSSWNTFLKKIITADGNLNAVKSITFTNFVDAPVDSSNLFSPIISGINYPLSKLTNINDFNRINFSNTTNMSNMFYNCSSLVSVDLKRLYCDDFIQMQEMFWGCSGLTSVSVEGATRTVPGMESMFNGCFRLVSVDFSKWSLSNSVDEGSSMSSMFKSCKALREFKQWEISGLSNDLGKVSTYGMFWGCSSLVEIWITGYGGGSMTNMFSGCWNLVSVVLEDIPHGMQYYNSMSAMFKDCYNLEYIDFRRDAE